MQDITRIVIKAESGFGCAEEAHVETITLSPSVIAYEYKPRVESEVHACAQWDYQADDPQFSAAFEVIAQALPAIFNPDEIRFCPDAGRIAFLVAFTDGSRKVIVHYCPLCEFKAVFYALRQLVPQGEIMPQVLRGAED